MGRNRDRSRSYSPRRRTRTPPPRRRYDEPRYHERRRSPGPTGLLVRNISLDAREEDLRVPFERFGVVKDVYLPKNYYTGEPRGFAFVKFRDAENAAEAKHHLNHTLIGGREIAIVFAAENRKTPQEMRRTGRISSHYGGSSRRRSPPRSPRHRYQSDSRSPSPPRRKSSGKGSRARDYQSPSRSVSRSFTPARRSSSPSKNNKSTFDPTVRKSDRRSISPLDPIIRSSDRRSRSPSDRMVRIPDRRSRSPLDPMVRLPDRRSRSPLDQRKVTRSLSRSRSRSRSYSPR
jgi:FUS-interacting serine-arginine-rich protein 1